MSCVPVGEMITGYCYILIIIVPNLTNSSRPNSFPSVSFSPFALTDYTAQKSCKIKSVICQKWRLKPGHRLVRWPSTPSTYTSVYILSPFSDTVLPIMATTSANMCPSAILSRPAWKEGKHLLRFRCADQLQLFRA